MLIYMSHKSLNVRCIVSILYCKGQKVMKWRFTGGVTLEYGFVSFVWKIFRWRRE